MKRGRKKKIKWVVIKDYKVKVNRTFHNRRVNKAALQKKPRPDHVPGRKPRVTMARTNSLRSR